MTKIHLILLETFACHLCEQALAIVAQCQAENIDVFIEHIDIAEFPEWQPQYAMRIPVLYHPETKKDLGWPFEQTQISRFINELSHD